MIATFLGEVKFLQDINYLTRDTLCMTKFRSCVFNYCWKGFIASTFLQAEWFGFQMSALTKFWCADIIRSHFPISPIPISSPKNANKLVMLVKIL